MEVTETTTMPGIEQRLLDLFLYLGSAWILYVLLFLSVLSIHGGH